MGGLQSCVCTGRLQNSIASLNARPHLHEGGLIKDTVYSKYAACWQPSDLVQRNDRPMAVCQGQVHARHLVLRHSHSSGMAASLAGHSMSGVSQCAECTGTVRKSLFSYIAGPRSDQQNLLMHCTEYTVPIMSCSGAEHAAQLTYVLYSKLRVTSRHPFEVFHTLLRP